MTDEVIVSETLTDDEGKDLDEGKDPIPERTEQEKATFNLKKHAERARELGIRPEDVLGLRQLKVDDSLSDDTPLTVGAFRQLQKEDAKKTALQLADDIEDEGERNEVKTILEKRIVPSTDPHADLALARSAVNARRTAMLSEDDARKIQAKQTASGGSADGRHEDQFVPTETESVMMAHPYNLTQAEVIAARNRGKKE